MVIKLGCIFVKINKNNILGDLLCEELGSLKSKRRYVDLDLNFQQIESSRLKAEQFKFSSSKMYGKILSTFSFEIIRPSKNHSPVMVNIYYGKKVYEKGIDKVKSKIWQVRDWTFLDYRNLTGYQVLNGIVEQLIFLNMVSKECAFLHASSVVNKEGEAFVFTGAGGVGKTSTIISLIQDYDYKFLSDDLTIITSDGKAKAYPRKIMLYAYNTQNNPSIVKRLFDKRSFVDKAQWYTRKTFKGLKLTRRRVLAEDIFGKDKIAREGKIKKVVYLKPTKSKTPKVKLYDGEKLAKESADIIRFEFRRFFDFWSQWGVASQKVERVEVILSKAQKIYSNCFLKSQIYLVEVPLGIQPKKLSDFIIKKVLNS